VFRTVPAPDVTDVHLSWPFSDVAAVIGGWQAWASFGPDEVAASLKVTAAADVDRPPAVDVYAAVRGSEGDAATLADQLAARVGRDPTAVAHRRMSFAETRRFWAQVGAVDLASAIPEPDDQTVPRHLVARSEFFRRPLPTDAIATLVAHLAARRTTGEEWELDFMPWDRRVQPGAAGRHLAAEEGAWLREGRCAVDHPTRHKPTARSRAAPAGPGAARLGQLLFGTVCPRRPSTT
jgi:hypothetical protein